MVIAVLSVAITGKESNNMKNHYICTGSCKGMSDKHGLCQAKDCPSHNEPLDTCDCIDGKHHNRQVKTELKKGQPL